MHSVFVLAFEERPNDRKYITDIERFATRAILVERRLQLSPVSAVEVVARGMSLSLARYGSATMSRACAKLLKEQKIDLIYVEPYYMMRHLPRRVSVPVILETQNVYQVLWQRIASRSSGFLRMLALREARATRKEEVAAWKRADAVVALSEPELAAILECVPGKLARSIQVGTDAVQLPFRSKQPEIPNILFIGHQTYYPNEDALRFLCSEVMPIVRQQIPNVTLDVVGRTSRTTMATASGPGVAVHGLVPEIEPFFRRASLLAVPLTIGAGVRLKIPEAMALGCPVVSTTVGCEGLTARPGSEILVADGPQAFADAIVTILKSPAFGREVARNARRWVEEHCTWDRFMVEVERLYAEVSQPHIA